MEVVDMRPITPQSWMFDVCAIAPQVRLSCLHLPYFIGLESRAVELGSWVWC